MGVRRVPEAAVVDQPAALVAGYAAWLLHRLIADLPGGLEGRLGRLGASPEHRAEVLAAHDALGYVGARWRIATHQAAVSVSGNEFASSDDPDVPSDGAQRGDLLSARDVATALGVSDRRVRQLAGSAHLCAQRDSGGRLWFKADIVEAERMRRAAA